MNGLEPLGWVVILVLLLWYFGSLNFYMPQFPHPLNGRGISIYSWAVVKIVINRYKALRAVSGAHQGLCKELTHILLLEIQGWTMKMSEQNAFWNIFNHNFCWLPLPDASLTLLRHVRGRGDGESSRFESVVAFFSPWQHSCNHSCFLQVRTNVLSFHQFWAPLRWLSMTWSRGAWAGYFEELALVCYMILVMDGLCFP